MKDIPVFTTENGAASLTLSQIPFSGKAYITLRATKSPELLLTECMDFCRACGAETLYAAGHEILFHYPHAVTLLTMRGTGSGSPGSAALWPLLPENRERWREIYNRAMEGVDNAVCLSYYDMEEMCRQGDCYFVHEKGELLGIGKASRGRLHAIAAVRRGAGDRVLSALLSLPDMEEVTLTVASTNHRAIRLYEKAGFLVTGEETVWYAVSEDCQGKILDKEKDVW